MPRLAVLGHPVAHSLSPAMHNAALGEMGLVGEWSYEALDVEPDDFKKTVQG
ncbi:MAG: shikimate dehydrogenase, partial [Solirubrobacterales bacterium]